MQLSATTPRTPTAINNRLGPAISRALTTATASIRRSPCGTGWGGTSAMLEFGKSQSQISPTTVTTISVQKPNAKIVKGSDRVRPYNNERGLNNGAARANAKIVP